MPLHDKHIPWPISAGVISLVLLPMGAIFDNASGNSLTPIDYMLYESFFISGIAIIIGFGMAFIICCMLDVNVFGMLIEWGKIHLFTALVLACFISIFAQVVYRTELQKAATLTYVDVNSANPNVKTSFTKSTTFSTEDGIMDYVKLFGLGKIDEKRHFTLIETRFPVIFGISPRVDFEYALVELPMGVEKLPESKEKISKLTLIAKKELSLK